MPEPMEMSSYVLEPTMVPRDKAPKEAGVL